jgi:hypothetical protein
VAERRQPGRAEHQVVAEREQHPDHHLEREVGIEADAGEPERRRREEDDDDEQRQRHEAGAWRRGGARGGAGRRRGHAGKHGHGRKECTF